MTRYSGITIFGLSVLGMAFTTLHPVAAFTLGSTTSYRSTFVAMDTALFSNQEEGEGASEEQSEGQFNWVEEWAMQGKDAVALMKTSERTQRAMLAQMTEDRIYEITKVLDTLVDQTTGEIAEADIPKAKELAMQTRNLQKEYKDLVTGAPSTMLETLASLNVSGDDKKKEGDSDEE